MKPTKSYYNSCTYLLLTLLLHCCYASSARKTFKIQPEREPADSGQVLVEESFRVTLPIMKDDGSRDADDPPLPVIGGGKFGEPRSAKMQEEQSQKQEDGTADDEKQSGMQHNEHEQSTTADMTSLNPNQGHGDQQHGAGEEHTTSSEHSSTEMTTNGEQTDQTTMMSETTSNMNGEQTSTEMQPHGEQPGEHGDQPHDQNQPHDGQSPHDENSPNDEDSQGEHGHGQQPNGGRMSTPRTSRTTMRRSVTKQGSRSKTTTQRWNRVNKKRPPRKNGWNSQSILSAGEFKGSEMNDRGIPGHNAV